MRTLFKLFIIFTALLALAAAFLWKNLTAPSAPKWPTTASASPSHTGKASNPGNTQGTSPTAIPPATSAADAVEAFDALKQRAKDGDAVSQRLLAQTYETCFIVNLNRERFLQSVQHSSLTDPAQVARQARIIQQRVQLCDAVDTGALIPTQLVNGWYAQAAANGDLAARATVYARQAIPMDRAAFTQLLDDVVASGDPAAMYSLGNALSRRVAENAGEPYTALVTGPMTSQAWMVAACRMGYDCGPESADATNFCLLVNRCEGETTEEIVFAMVPTAEQRQALERQAQQIIDAVSP